MKWDLVAEKIKLIFGADWSITAIKTGLSTAILFIGKWLYQKKIKPFAGQVAQIPETIAQTKKNTATIALLDSYRRATFDVFIDPFFETNNKGEVTYVNSAYVKELGLNDPRDVYGMNFMILIPDEDIDKMERQGERLIKHPAPFDGKVRLVHQKTSDIITFHCRTSLIFDEKGVWQGNVGRLYIPDE